MLIEEAAGIEVREAAHAIARKNLNEAKLEHSEALHKVSLIDAHIANVAGISAYGRETVFRF
ncbi:hypothetical protein [Acinetobacter baumannii]|uniref:hypothetical protein n=1 Tax=Acinetobacter baumannii TaxID=470 RepID=UPI003CFE6064